VRKRRLLQRAMLAACPRGGAVCEEEMNIMDIYVGDLWPVGIRLSGRESCHEDLCWRFVVGRDLFVRKGGLL